MMDMEKLDILDMVMLETIYDRFAINKHETAYIKMESKPIDANKIDTEVLLTEEEQVDFILDLAIMLYNGPTAGEYTNMDIIYTVFDDEDIIICGLYQQIHKNYIILQYRGESILINSNKDEDYYYQFYTLVSLFKEFYTL